MTLASICRQVSVLVGVGPADAWIGNIDQSATEIVAWVNESQQRVAAEHPWSALTRDATLTVTAATEQVVTLPSDVARIVPDSVYLRNFMPVVGPLTPAEWQEHREMIGWVQAAFTMSGGSLLLRTAGVSGPLVLRYVADIADYTSDIAVSALGLRLERVIMLCAVALYRDAKGLQAGSAGQQYLSALAQAKSWEQPIAGLSMGRRPARRGGVRVGVGGVFTLDGSLLG